MYSCIALKRYYCVIYMSDCITYLLQYSTQYYCFPVTMNFSGVLLTFIITLDLYNYPRIIGHIRVKTT